MLLFADTPANVQSLQESQYADVSSKCNERCLSPAGFIGRPFTQFPSTLPVGTPSFLTAIRDLKVATYTQKGNVLPDGPYAPERG